LRNDNALISCSCSSSSSSASSVIGAAVENGTGTANAITVNMNDSQTLSAVAYYQNAPADAKVNIFGADQTDAEDGDFGWRVRIFVTGEDIKESA
jgi:hypothetical protein